MDILTQALAELRTAIAPQRMAHHLSAAASQIDQDLITAITGEISAFTDSRNPRVVQELTQHGQEHTLALTTMLASGEPPDLDFVARHARQRAEQFFPLEATLHAYRCGHRVFLRALRAAAVHATRPGAAVPAEAIAEIALEYTNAVSSCAAETYLAQQRAALDSAQNRSAELLGMLLAGYDEGDRRINRTLREAGLLEARQAFCVLIAQSVDPAQMLHAQRAQRLAQATSEVLRAAGVSRLIEVRDHKVIAVAFDTQRLSGWSRPRTPLSDRLIPALRELGPAALVGISSDVDRSALIPGAYRDALMALELADVSRRVTRVSDLSLREILIGTAGATALLALPPWAQAFLAADRKASGMLTTTLRAYADASMNVLKTGARLSLHPNTIYARLQRISDLTGLDAKRYHALDELLLVADCAAAQASPHPQNATTERNDRTQRHFG